MRIRLATAAVAMVLLAPMLADARAAGDPIRLAWLEGDVAGMSTVYGPDGRQVIGSVEYRQARRGDRLSCVRVTRFRDGSSDEDWAEARVAETLEAIAGRSVIRDVGGEAIVDLTIDVAAGHITGSWGRGEDRHAVDQHVALPKGTYWGPLIFIVLKNFDANAEDGRLTFRTVAPTPRPIVLDMEFTRGDGVVLERTGARLDARRFDLTPTIHWSIDPLIRMVTPRAAFWMLPGDPPALARFAGPRNYARHENQIQ